LKSAIFVGQSGEQLEFYLFVLIRLQHDETHERAAERPLILTILKHDAFEQQQHDRRQRAAKRIGEMASTDRK
jgi:hypothetical protein